VTPYTVVRTFDVVATCHVATTCTQRAGRPHCCPPTSMRALPPPLSRVRAAATPRRQLTRGSTVAAAPPSPLPLLPLLCAVMCLPHNGDRDSTPPAVEYVTEYPLTHPSCPELLVSRNVRGCSILLIS